MLLLIVPSTFSRIAELIPGRTFCSSLRMQLSWPLDLDTFEREIAVSGLLFARIM